jgi:hypothetical protein
MGHDANSLQQVIAPIEKVKAHFNNKSKLHSFGNTFCFRV